MAVEAETPHGWLMYTRPERPSGPGHVGINLSQAAVSGRALLGSVMLFRHEKWASEKAVLGLICALVDAFGPVVREGGQVDEE